MHSPQPNNPPIRASRAAVAIIALALGCATREVGTTSDPGSPLNAAQHPAGAEVPVTAALSTDPPAPGESTNGWAGLAPTAATPAGDPHRHHHHQHGSAPAPAMPDAGAPGGR